jgi:molecular chaperone GrpE
MPEPQPSDPSVAPPTGAAPPPPVPEAAPAPPPADPLAEARREAAHHYDRFLRAVADLENYRRRTNREKEELRQFAATAVLRDLLPVLDHLELGFGASRQQADAKAVTEGVALVLEQLKGVLGRHGLQEVNPSGRKFDPHLHESISHLPSNEVPEEHVLQVVRTGYTLNGRLLRPASVVLSSGPPPKGAA